MAGRKPVHADYLKKDPSKVQEGFAEWIAKVTGHTVPVGDVALVQRLYPLYLKTPEVVKAREAAATARKREEEERAKRVREQKEAKLLKLEQDRHRLMQELGIEPEGEVPTLVPVPAPEPETDDTDEHPLVLGEADDEFVEPTEEDPADDDWGDDEDEDEEDF